MDEPVYLIDGSACIYRAYHAITPLSAPDGLPTHAVYGFTNILLKILRDKKVRYLSVAFDKRGPTFRHALDPSYKANRPPMPDDLAAQIPFIRDIVTAYNIMVLEKEGMEADDLIASAALSLSRAGTKVVIVSGDKDLHQLVSPLVTVWDPMKDKELGPLEITQKYGLPPEMLLDYFALVGDSSDNIKGAPGIGPKTAARLMQDHGSLEKILQAVGSSPKGKIQARLAEEKDTVLLSRELVRLRHDCDVPGAPASYFLGVPDNAALRRLFTRLGFSRLLQTEVQAEPVDPTDFRLVQTLEEVRQLVERLKKCAAIAIDVETSSLDVATAELTGIAIGAHCKELSYIPLGHKDAAGNAVEGQPDFLPVRALLLPLLQNAATILVGHNLKFDYAVLKKHGMELQGVLWDTMIASYLINPTRRTHKLDDLCRELLDLRLTTFAEVTQTPKDGKFPLVALSAARDYACEDILGALMLKDLFQGQLEEMGLSSLFHQLESPLIPVLSRMEATGIRVDIEALTTLSLELAEELDRLEHEIHTEAGVSFAINSPKQLAEVLFDRLGLPKGKKIQTGYSTDVKVLESLANLHEAPRLVLQYRNLTKLKSTYADKLAAEVSPDTGRIHTSFNQTVTATGRLSSSHPNLQNIPIRTEEGQRIRRAFIPDPGNLFVAGDYSQIDLRVLAHYSKDKSLLTAFHDGDDIHTRTAAEIFRVNPLLVSQQMRRVAKTINFGIVYGMSSFGLAQALAISRKEATLFIKRYFEHYQGVERFMREIVAQAREKGFVTTLLGRRRPLPDINSSNRTRREFAERAAINTPIQGTAADIIKLAMLAVDNRLQEIPARLLLQIHDELVVEVEKEKATKTQQLLKAVMEKVFQLDIPLVAHVTVGENLAKW